MSEAPGNRRDAILAALSEGMVLLDRSVHGNDGGRRLVRQHLLVRPVFAEGLLVDLLEDERTLAANRDGRLKYGIRAGDVDQRMLREMAPDVYWLGPRGASRVAQISERRPRDLWTDVLPCSINHRPSFDGSPAVTVNSGSDPDLAFAHLARHDRDAAAALLEGLHLVDVADLTQNRAERRTWRPLRPRYDGLRVVGYGTDARVLRYTANSGRTGFSQKTFAILSPLLEESGYDPVSDDMGHSYRLSDRHADDVRTIVDWKRECADEQVAMSDQDRRTIAILEGVEPYPREGLHQTDAARAIAAVGANPKKVEALVLAALRMAR